MHKVSQNIITSVSNPEHLAKQTASVSDLSPEEFRIFRRKRRMPAEGDEIAYNKYKNHWKNPTAWGIPLSSAMLGAILSNKGIASKSIGAISGAGIGLIIEEAMHLARNRKMRQYIINSANAYEYLS